MTGENPNEGPNKVMSAGFGVADPKVVLANDSTIDTVGQSTEFKTFVDIVAPPGSVQQLDDQVIKQKFRHTADGRFIPTEGGGATEATMGHGKGKKDKRRREHEQHQRITPLTYEDLEEERHGGTASLDAKTLSPAPKVELKGDSVEPFRPHIFNTTFVYLLKPVIPNIFLTPEVYEDAIGIGSWSGLDEIGFLGTVMELCNNRYLIDKVFMVKQQVRYNRSELINDGEDGISAYLTGRMAAGDFDTCERIKFWGHVHPKNNTNPTEEDEMQMKEFRRNDWFIRGIFGRNGRIEFSFYNFKENYMFKDCPWQVLFVPNPDRHEYWRQQVERLVIRKPVYEARGYNPKTGTYSGGTGWKAGNSGGYPHVDQGNNDVGKYVGQFLHGDTPDQQKYPINAGRTGWGGERTVEGDSIIGFDGDGREVPITPTKKLALAIAEGGSNFGTDGDGQVIEDVDTDLRDLALVSELSGNESSEDNSPEFSGED